MKISDVLKEEFESIKEDIIKLYDAKGMRASGAFADSLEVRLDSDLSVSLWGFNYADQLNFGRRAGAVSREGSENLKKWIQNKGVFETAIAEIGLDSLTFLIKRKLEREGYNREGYGGVKLIEEVITAERVNKILERVSQYWVLNIETEFTDRITELKKNNT